MTHIDEPESLTSKTSIKESGHRHMRRCDLNSIGTPQITTQEAENATIEDWHILTAHITSGEWQRQRSRTYRTLFLLIRLRAPRKTSVTENAYSLNEQPTTVISVKPRVFRSTLKLKKLKGNSTHWSDNRNLIRWAAF